MDRTVADVKISIEGKELTIEWRAMLQTIIVQVPEQGPARMSLVFADPKRNWSKVNKFGGGAKIEASLQLEQRKAIVFSGELTAVRSRVKVGGGLNLILEATDKLHRLSRSDRQRVFMDVTDGDVIEKLASECGMKADVDDSGLVYNSIFQYGIDNTALLQERTARLGLIYWAEGDKLIVRPRRPKAGHYKLVWTTDLLELRIIRTAARMTPEVRVRSWDIKAKKETVGIGKVGDEKLVDTKGKPVLSVVKSAFSDAPFQIGTVPVRSMKEAEAIAKGRLERSSLGFFVARGRCRGHPLIKPGSLLEFEQVPAECAGVYRVVQVIHRYDARGLLSDFEARRNHLPDESKGGDKGNPGGGGKPADKGGGNPPGGGGKPADKGGGNPPGGGGKPADKGGGNPPGGGGKPADKGGGNPPGGGGKPADKKPEDKKPGDKKPEDKKPEDKKKNEDPQKALKLTPIIGSVGPQDWVTYHHATMFVELKVKGAFKVIQFHAQPYDQWPNYPMITGIWKCPDSGSWTTISKMMIGCVGDTHGGGRPCKVPHGPHSTAWTQVWGPYNQNKGWFQLDTLTEGRYVIAVYARNTGTITIRVSGTGEDAKYKDTVTLVHKGQHPNPGD